MTEIHKKWYQWIYACKRYILSKQSLKTALHEIPEVSTDGIISYNSKHLP